MQSGLWINGEVTDEDIGIGFVEGSIERVNVSGWCGLILGELGLGELDLTWVSVKATCPDLWAIPGERAVANCATEKDAEQHK